MVSSMNNRTLKATITFTTLIVGLHVLGYFYPKTLFWGFSFLGFLPIYDLFVYVTLSVVLLASILIRSVEGPLSFVSEFMENKPVIFLLICIVIFIGGVSLFHVRVPLRGDSFFVINNLQNTFRGAHLLYTYSEPLAMGVFYLLLKLLGTVRYPEMMRGFLLVDALLGIGFIINLFVIVRNLLTDPKAQALLFFYVLAAPTMQLFLGYVESYPVVLFSLSAFLLVVVLYVKLKLPFYIVPPLYLVQVIVHFLNFLFMPALIYLAYREWKNRGAKNVLIGMGTTIALAAIILLAAGGEIARYLPQTAHTHYLSFAQTDSRYQAYTLLSPYHMIDLLNLLILIAPFTIFLVAIVYIEDRMSLLKSTEIRAFALLAVPVLLSLLVLKFDLGTAKDWDIGATFVFVPSLFACYAFLQVRGIGAVKIMGLIIATAFLTTLPYFHLNARTESSIRRYKTLLDNRITPYDSRWLALNHLSWYYYYSRDTAGLNPLWRNYIVQNPRDWRGYSTLVKSLVQFGDLKDKMIDSLFERWIALEPDSSRGKNEYASFCLTLGKLLVHEGKLEQALERNERAIGLNPKLPIAYNNLGVTYYSMHDNDKAIRCYQKTIELDSTYALAYVNMGNAYDEKAEPDSAIAWYKKAISIEPGNALAFENLGATYYRKGEIQNGIEAMKRAARLGDPDAKEFLRNIGESW